MQRFIFLSAVFFIFQNLFSQSYDIRLDNENVTYNYIENEQEKAHPKMHFGVYDGQLYLFNRMKERDPSGKTLLYIKNWDLYIISDGKSAQYQTLKQAFPKNGFYKTGKQKIFFGKSADSYVLENDLLDITLWFANGKTENNPLEKYFREMNLLGNLPEGKVLIAAEIMNLEVDAQNLIAKNTSMYYPDFRSFFEYDKDYEKCKNNLPESKELDVVKLAIPTTQKFSYKITANVAQKNETKESIVYSDDFRNYELQINRNQTCRSFFIDYKNKFVLYGSLEGTIFRYEKAVALQGNLCNRNRYFILEDTKDYSKIITLDRDTHNHSMSISTLDKKEIASFLYEFPGFDAKGFISKSETLDDRFSSYRANRSLQKENFTIQIVPQNEK